jgi:hypothetical protein
MNLEARADAATRLLAYWNERPLDYAKGDHCVAMARVAFMSMGAADPLPIWARSVKSEKSALRALARLGDIREHLDPLAERIHPLNAVAMDVVLLPSDGAMPALAVAMGSGDALAFVPIAGLRPMALLGKPLTQALCAWRTPEVP